MINRLIVEVLGWEWSEVATEPHARSGYIDYLIRHRGTNTFVIEAKRTGYELLATVSDRRASFKLGGPALRPARDGIEQAAQYCLETGVPCAALTNGATWLGFRPIRTDGTPFFDGKAIIFPSLESISENFAEFYDLFSREGVPEGRYAIHLNRAEGLVVSNGEDLNAVIPESDIRLQPKTPLARDLDTVFAEFFTSLSGDNNPEMLATCFVESAESHDADRNLEKITRDVIDYVEQIHAGGELQREIEASVETQRGQTVLIIGNKGSGKSTFVDRFFSLVLDKALRRRCLVLRLDLADSTGDLIHIHTWLTTRLREEIEVQLYKGSTPDFDELLGIVFREYQRWSTSEFKYLYESNKMHFKIRFGEYLYGLIETDADRYVLRVLQHSILGRRLTPCLIFDNTDHFPQPFQETVFQYAQAIFRAVLSVVIVPVTDRTVWQLSKSGPSQSYATRTFYLPSHQPVGCCRNE